jgi:hypothetical protein
MLHAKPIIFTIEFELSDGIMKSLALIIRKRSIFPSKCWTKWNSTINITNSIIAYVALEFIDLFPKFCYESFVGIDKNGMERSFKQHMNGMTKNGMMCL